MHPNNIIKAVVILVRTVALLVASLFLYMLFIIYFEGRDVLELFIGTIMGIVGLGWGIYGAIFPDRFLKHIWKIF